MQGAEAEDQRLEAMKLLAEHMTPETREQSSHVIDKAAKYVHEVRTNLNTTPCLHTPHTITHWSSNECDSLTFFAFAPA